MPKKSEGVNPAVFVDKKKKKPTSSPSSPIPNKESKTKTPRDEIDEIFAATGKKRKKLDDDKEKRPRKKDSAVKDAKSKRASKISANEKLNSKKNDESKKENGGLRKRTGNGLAIYTEEELGIGNADAGGTPLCPFDCDCCF